jgi:hypothetical protein
VRTVQVDAGRLARWCEGFAAQHGGPPAVVRDGEALVLHGPDGETARLLTPFPLAADACDLDAVLRWSAAPRRCAVLLVRRGGYACAALDGATVTASKVGTRYVQGRTAAGGWSQQRFARRRENQTDGLVTAAIETAVRILLNPPVSLPVSRSVTRPLTPPVSPRFEWLVTGGDAALVAKALADPRLRRLADLPRGPHLAVGDPRSDVVRAVPEMLRKVRIQLSEPVPQAGPAS